LIGFGRIMRQLVGRRVSLAFAKYCTQGRPIQQGVIAHDFAILDLAGRFAFQLVEHIVHSEVLRTCPSIRRHEAPLKHHEEAAGGVKYGCLALHCWKSAQPISVGCITLYFQSAHVTYIV
jgi:hypothetical protein